MTSADFEKILRILSEYRVEFIIVGGVSAVLQGVPLDTFDLDIVHKRDPDNIERLLGALDKLDAYYRIQAARRLRPNASHLRATGHGLLVTSYGNLDVLGSVDESLTYEDLLDKSELMSLSDDWQGRVLNLETLIELKEKLGRDKDRAALFLLRHTLEEKRRR